jgi:hypothetical protein
MCGWAAQPPTAGALEARPGAATRGALSTPCPSPALHDVRSNLEAATVSHKASDARLASACYEHIEAGGGAE